MMRNIVIKKKIPLLIFIAVLLMSLFAGCFPWGDPGVEICVDNRTDQTLSIFITELYEYDVPPRKVVRFGTMEISDPDLPWALDKYLIEAKTKQGEVVYSEEFTWQELDDMDWTIVISSSAE